MINSIYEIETSHGLLPVGFNYDSLPAILQYTAEIENLKHPDPWHNNESNIIRTRLCRFPADTYDFFKLDIFTNRCTIYGDSFISYDKINKKLLSKLSDREFYNGLNIFFIETVPDETIIDYIKNTELTNVLSQYSKKIIKSNFNFKVVVIDNKEGSYYYDDLFFNKFKDLYNNIALSNDKQIFFITNSNNITYDYNRYLERNNIKSFMTVGNINFFITGAASAITTYFEKTKNQNISTVIEHNYQISIPTEDDIYNERSKYFLNFNRNSGRLHRPKLVLELIKNNLFDKGLISLLKSDKFDSFCNEAGNQEYRELIASTYPYVLDYSDPNYVSDLNQYLTDSNLWLNTYFSIISETSVDKNTSFITEKTLKAIIYLHPFIVWGNPNTLLHLKNLGFETFPEFFNEDYDSELNYDIRLNKVIKNVKQLCSLSISELHELYLSIVPKLLKNRNRLLELAHNKYEYTEFLNIII